MPTALQQALRLEQIALCDVFTGSEVDKTPWGRVFGGQILAQSLVAAQHTVDSTQRVHSLSGFFLLPGESGVELMFEVERVRDGRSFATRVVKALQRSKAIFLMTVSFHVDEPGLEFQRPARELKNIAQFHHLGNTIPLADGLLKKGFVAQSTGDADTGNNTQAVAVAEGPWWSLRWCRHNGRLEDDEHTRVLAWMSDLSMVSTVRKPHGPVAWYQSVSLDHSLHFHRSDWRADEWLLFNTRTSVSAGGRGLARTEVFTERGVLVASITQEALIRPTRSALAKAKL
eukprot:TRINITY_DN2800_c0_g1_i2.p1 TRINITY_DN2800_c0_g1~~TRINITY_DN2800_c0_g1_i2.p1  ORF type:complete len:286 (+),score=71.52 TRINITY_DN2800_c0_g1_i2:101-958(+)